MANEVVFKAVTRFVNRDSAPGVFRKLRAVMNNDLGKGGHLSSQPMGALFNFVDINPATNEENCINFPVRSDNMYRIDTDLLAALERYGACDVVIVGRGGNDHIQGRKGDEALKVRAI